MSAVEICKRESSGWQNGSRFCFYSLFFLTVSFAQSDSSLTINISAGTEYFDIFRQTSDRSRTVALSKQTYATLSAMFENDSLSLTYRSIEHYAAFNQNESRFNASLKNSLQSVRLSFASALYFFDYSLALGIPLNTPSHPFYYKAAVFTSPFGSLLNFDVALERSPSHYNNSISFQDFFVPLRDVSTTTTISYTIRSTPFSDLSSAIHYYESDENKKGVTTGYGVTTEHQYFGKKISLQYSFSHSTFLQTEIGTEEFRTDLTFKQNDQSFGDLSNGSGKHSTYIAILHTKELSFPLSIKYSFEQLSLSGVGHFESWPFTSLAASIIANRLNYQISGFIKHHSLETKSNVEFESSSLAITASYHRISPDAVLEHWEPEFLVFGMKNFTRDPFSIKDIHLAQIGLRYDFPFQGMTLSTFIEQYIPISITYRKHETISPPAQPSAPTDVTHPSTDGGRRFGLTFTTNF